MRLHRLHLRNVKGVEDRSVTFPDAPVVVIEGPNEVGKSTFVEALDRLLDPRAKASSRAATVQSLQPVGLDAGPHVEAEFSIGEHRVIFAKRWLRQPSTTLQILQPAPGQFTGEAAQQRMNAILDEYLDRPLFEALRFAQSGPPGHIDLSDSAVLEAALDGAAGADLHTEGGADLLAAVEQEYLRYYTASHGKPTGDLRAAIAGVQAAQDEAVLAHQSLAEAEQLIARRDAAAAQLGLAEETLGERQRELDRARVEVTGMSDLREQHRAARMRAEAAEAALLGAQRDLASRHLLIQALAERKTEMTQRAEAVTSSAARAQRRSNELSAAQERLNRARADCLKAQADADAADDSVSDAQLALEVASLTQRLGEAEQLGVSLQAARETLGAQQVSEAVLRQITTTQQALEVAEAAVDAASTTVEVQALAGQHQVSLDGEALELTSPGDPAVFEVTSPTEVVLNDAVRFQIRPVADVARRAEQRDTLRAEMRGQLDAVGASDVCAARALAAAHGHALAEESKLSQDLDTVLGLQDEAQLRAALEDRRALLQAEAPADPAQRGAPDLDQARLAHAQAQQRLRPMRKAREAAEDEVAGLREQEAATRGARDVARARHSDAETERTRALRMLEQERSRIVDLDLEVAVDAPRSEHAQAVKDLAQMREHLRQARVDDVEARHAEADRLAVVQARALKAMRADFHEIRGRLEMTAGEGRQENYDRAAQAFDDARRGLDAIEQRARAARQLHSTLQRHRDRAHASYVAPYARAIEKLGVQMYGESFSITVSPDLVITHRHLHGSSVPFAQLSGGAKEQLGILARLAVSSLVHSRGGVPVIIDDALGYTDPERLRRVGTVLGSSESMGQIIFLTCTPARYAGIAGAHTMSLGA